MNSTTPTPETTPAAAASPPTPPTVVTPAEIAGTMTRLAEGIEAVLARLNPGVTQAPAAALAAAENTLRAQVPGADRQKLAKLTEEMAALQRKHDDEMDRLRLASDHRRSSYSLGEMVERVEGEFAVTRAETNEFWQRSFLHPTQRDPEAMRPVEILLRGAYESKVIEVPFGNKGATFRQASMSAMTAGSDDPVLRRAQDAMDVLRYWIMYRRARGEEFSSITECKFYPEYVRAMQDLAKALPGFERSAMTATTLANWVPTGFSARIIERFEMERNLLRFIPFFQMTQNPEQIGRRGAYLTPSKRISSASNPEDQATKIRATTTSPGKLLLNLHQFTYRVIFDIEAEEDTIPALVPSLVEDLGRSRAYAMESAILNSSDAVEPVPGHIDTDITLTDDYRTTWQGLRPEALARSYTHSIATFNGDTVTVNDAMAMGKYSDPANIIRVCGPKGRAKLSLMRDSSGNQLMVGSAAPANPSTFQSGKRPVQELGGSPLVAVESHREDVNASGFYDGTTSNQGTILTVYTPGWTLAARNLAGRQVTFFNTETAQTELFSHERLEFEDMLDSSTEHTVELGVGLTF